MKKKNKSEFVIRNQTEKEEQLLVVLISTQAVHLIVYFVHAFIALLLFSKHKKIIQIVNVCELNENFSEGVWFLSRKYSAKLSY